MAQKNAEAQIAVNQRRLQDVYSCLDSDMAQKAESMADKVIKKFPELLAAKVLRALAILRQGRTDEGRAILDSLDTLQVYDTHTHEAFLHCYKELGLPDRCIRLYENAVKVNPTEQNYVSLFFAYVRVLNYEKMKLTAMQLQRFKVPEHKHWFLLCQLLETRAFPLKSANIDLVVRSIEQILEKNEGNYQDIVEFDLHLAALEMSNNNRAVILLLEKEGKYELRSRPKPFVNQTIIKYLMRERQYESAFAWSRKMILNNHDDWSGWKTCIDILQIYLTSNMDAPMERAAKELHDFVGFIMDHITNVCPERGPHMARLELGYRIRKHDFPPEAKKIVQLAGHYENNLAQYINHFHKKPCCYTDLEKYLNPMENDPKYFKHLETILIDMFQGYSYDSAVDSAEFATRAYCLRLKIGIKLGYYTFSTREDKVALVKKAMEIWDKMRFVKPEHEQEEPKIRGEFAYAELAYIVICVLWKDWEEQNENQWQSIVEANIFADWVAERLQEDYFSKVAKMRFCGQIGFHTHCKTLFTMLDIKSVQQDTLGFYMFPLVELSGRIHKGLEYYGPLSKYFIHSERDIIDAVIGAIQKKSIIQIPGILDLTERIAKSSMSAAATVMDRYIHSLFALERKSITTQVIKTLDGTETDYDWDGLCDNRDITLLPIIEPGDQAARLEQLKTQSQREFVDIAKLRHLLMNSMAAVGLVQKFDAEQLRDIVVLFKTHLKHCASNYLVGEPSRCKQTAPSQRLADWVHQGHFTPIVRLLDGSVQIALTQKEGAEVTLELLPTAGELTNMLLELIPVFDDTRGPFFFHEPLFKASRTAQAFSTCHILIEYIRLRLGLTPATVTPPPAIKTSTVRSFKNTKNSSILAQKKNKKVQAASNPMIGRLNELDSALRDVLVKFSDYLETYAAIIVDSDKLCPPLGEDLGEHVLDALKPSYEQYRCLLRTNYSVCLSELVLVLQVRFKLKVEEKSSKKKQ